LREQGLGDEVFFLRFAPALKAAGARVTYQATNKIGSLFSRLESLDEVLPEEAPVPPADLVMLLGDLPHALSRADTSPLPPAKRGERLLPMGEYSRQSAVFWPKLPDSVKLPPSATALSAMQKRLAAIGKPPYIGLSWKGGTAPDKQHSGAGWLLFKEIGIRGLADSLRDLPATFIALQRKPLAGEMDSLSRSLGRDVHDFTELNGDLESMLAVLALIDEYIGVSNTNMHLRAAVGRTARVLVPQPAEWRWTTSGTTSPWFPGFSIYRQSTDGSWTSALAKLGKELREAIQ
jgi:hypothetical protein